MLEYLNTDIQILFVLPQNGLFKVILVKVILVHQVKAMAFPVGMYGWESWTIKKAEVTQLCLTLCDPVDCVHGIFQARVLEWVAVSFSRGSSRPRELGLLHCRQMLYHLSHQGSVKESWAPKNWCFWTVELEKTLESPLDCKEIKPVNIEYWLEISPEYSLEGLMLKLKLQYFGHLMRRTDSFEKTLMMGKIEGGRRKGQ